MAKKYKPGQEVNGYRIIEFLTAGNMAISYKAEAGDGSRIFLKQYKSPSARLPWYDAYVAYQKELNRRIGGSRAAQFCVRPRQPFELPQALSDGKETRSYWVAYEFVEGFDLQGLFAPAERRGGEHVEDTWENRVVWAKLLMAGVAAMHGAGVVHTDLKPENVHLIPASIGVGYALKLIDMDFSILTDQRAPWLPRPERMNEPEDRRDANFVYGYFGTTGYQSPEHFKLGEQPVSASDVFTCGLILYGLLGKDGNPYPADDMASYQRMALTHAAPLPRLRGRSTHPDADIGFVAEVIHRCLSPDIADRPTADQVNRALNGKLDRAELRVSPVRVTAPVTSGARHAPTAVTPPAAPPAIPPAPPVAAGRAAIERETSSLCLVDASGHALTIGVRTELGKHMLGSFGEDARHWHSPQCTIEREASGGWRVIPNTAAPNATMLNGRAICLPSPLGLGDVLAVGNPTKGITKMPLTVTRK